MTRKKKILVGFFGVIVCVFLILLILPFVINLNKFKPQIQNLVSEKMNAKIDFSSACLSILSGLGVNLQDVRLENTDKDFANTPFFTANNVKFRVEFWPLLTKQFVGEVFVQNPKIFLYKKGDETNVKALFVKENDVESGVTDDASRQSIPLPGKENEQDKPSQALPSAQKGIENSIVVKAFEVKNATLVYEEQTKEQKNADVPTSPILQVSHLNLSVSNIGVGRQTEINASTQVDFHNAETTIKGPVQFHLVGESAFTGKQWDSFSFTANLNLDKIALNYNDVFVKSDTIPLQISLKGLLSPQNFHLQDMQVNMSSLQADLKADIQNFNKLNTTADVSLQAKDLSPLSSIFPKHQKLLSKGNMEFKAHIQGSLRQESNLKIQFNLNALFADSDFNITGNTDSLRPFVGSMNLVSQKLEADELIAPFLSSESKKEKDSTLLLPQKESSTSSAKKDALDQKETSSSEKIHSPLLSSDQKQFLFEALFEINANIKHFSYDKFKANDIVLRANLKKDEFNISSLFMNVFAGTVNFQGSSELGKYPLPFQGKLNARNVKIQELVGFVDPKWRALLPLSGELVVNSSFNGEGYSKEDLNKSFAAQGNYVLQKGVLYTKSLINIATEQLNKALQNTSVAGIKLDADQVKGFALKVIDDHNKNIKDLKGTFEINKGSFATQGLFASEDGSLNYKTSIGLFPSPLEGTLAGEGLYTASDKVKDNFVSQNKYGKYFLDDKGVLSARFSFSGTVENPSVSVDTAILKNIVLKNAGKGASDKIKEEIKKNPGLQKIEEDAKKLLEKNGIDLKKFGF